MKLFIITVSLLLSVCGLPNISEWEKFKDEYGKKYKHSQEENFRYNIFRKNLAIIRDHNEKFSNGETTFKLEVNQFADMTVDEFKNFLGYQKHSKPILKNEMNYASFNESIIPNFMNWTDAGAVTAVKDQEACGSCWSFSSVGSLEGQYFRKTGKLVSLSAQNLVDCDTTCSGCNGGWMDLAFEYIKENGISTDEDYPYTGENGTCAANSTSTFIKISSYRYVEENNEDELKKAVATSGPISVAIDATIYFQFYYSGIFNDKTCKNSKSDLNHAVLVVGYGTDDGKDYWLIKNSWGQYWGQYGYAKMTRNANNQCGIATSPVYPII